MEVLKGKLNISESREKRILIYDDNIEILNLCSRIFRKNDYQLKTLLSCDDVINEVKNFKPHFILMDLWIPFIGGERAVKLLKENSNTKNIPVFLFSANSEIQDICKRVRADGFIAKPFKLLEFRETIDSQIRITIEK